MDLSLFSEKISLEIFSYLINADQIAFSSCNQFYHQRWIRKLRSIELHHPLSELFIVDDEFRRKILSKIDDPLTQLSLLDLYLSGGYNMENIDTSVHVAGLHHLTVDCEAFEFLMDKSEIEQIHHLFIVGSMEVRLFSNFSDAKKAILSLTFADVQLSEPLEDYLSPTLTELELNFCERKSINKEESEVLFLPLLPNLQKLVIENTLIGNLEQFHYLQELHLRNISIPQLICFQYIPNLTIDNCNGFTDWNCLQYNQQITILNCHDMINYTQCFKDSKVITLQFPYKLSSIMLLDISIYSLVETLKIDFNDCRLNNSQISSNLVPRTLTTVNLKRLALRIQLNMFCNVKSITLDSCTGVKSLEGLEDVEEVKLICLTQLSSLEGLGRNNEVHVITCHLISDFSPIRQVANVLIKACPKFTNAEDVAGVFDLTISNCSNIIDLSPLRKVHSIRLEKCPKIISIKVLKGVVPVLKIIDCDNVRNYGVPHFGLMSRLFNSHDGIGKIPDSIYGVMFEFLEYNERIKFISMNGFLYETLMKKTRQITLRKSNRMELFFTNVTYFNEILEKIENPLQQLEATPFGIFHHLVILRFDFGNNLCCPLGFQKLQISCEFFETLCERSINQNALSIHSTSIPQQVNDWKVHQLILSDNGYARNPSFHQIERYLSKALTTLNIELFEKITSLDYLSPSLEELYIGRSADTSIILPQLQKLRVLSIISCTIINLTDFNYLQKLILDHIAVTDVTPFQTIPSISFIHCNQLQDISTLQSHRFVETCSCARLREYRNALSRCKEIIIDTSEYHDVELLIDVSRFQCVERLSLRSWDLAGEQLIMMSESLPSSLRVIELMGKISFDNNFTGFHGLERVTLDNYLYESLEGLGLSHVREIVLNQLDYLTSLEGLQQEQHSEHTVLRSATISYCPKITDFSPLNYFHKVSIMNCDGFRNGFEVDHVHELLIDNCSNLRDISMLKNIPKLEVKYCKNIIHQQFFA